MLSLRLRGWGREINIQPLNLIAVDIFSSVLQINHILAAQHINTKEIQINFVNNPGEANRD